MVALHFVAELEDVLLGLGLVIVEVLLLHAEPLVPRDHRLTKGLLDYVLGLEHALLFRNDDVLVQLVSLSLDQCLDCFTHLLDQEVVELGVEVVPSVSREAPDRLISPLEVLLDDPDDRLLHLLLEDVVLALRVHFVEELFLNFLELLVVILARHLLVLLHLGHLLLEEAEELLRQGLHCQRDLLAEVVASVIAGAELLKQAKADPRRFDLATSWISRRMNDLEGRCKRIKEGSTDRLDRAQAIISLND